MYSLSYTGIEFMNILYLQVYIYSKQYLRLCYKFTAAMLCLLLYTFNYLSLYTCLYTSTNSTFILICNTSIGAYFILPGLGAAVRAAAIAHVPYGSFPTMSSVYSKFEVHDTN